MMKSLVCLCLMICSQLALAGEAVNHSAAITQIREQYQLVNQQLESYQVIEFDFYGESSDGASVKAWLNEQGQLQRADVSYFGEMGEDRYEIYYQAATSKEPSSQVFFIYWRQFNYNAPYFVDAQLAAEMFADDALVQEIYDPNKTRVTEWRYYFNEQQLIRQIDNQGVISDGKQASSGLIELAEDINQKVQQQR